MAKAKVLENGLTEKLNIVLETVRANTNGVTADEAFVNKEVANACKTINSVRSSLARLDKTLGLVKSKTELANDKLVKRYFV